MAAPAAETAVENLLSMCQDKLDGQELAIVKEERAVLVAKKLVSPDIIALLTVEQLEGAGMSLGAAAALKKAFPSAGSFRLTGCGARRRLRTRCGRARGMQVSPKKGAR